MSLVQSPSRSAKRDFEESFGSNAQSPDQRSILKPHEPQHPAPSSLPTPPVDPKTAQEMSPARSSTGSIMDASTPTPSRSEAPPTSSTAPSAFAALDGATQPPPKKAKLSFAEKEMERVNKQIRDQEKAAEKEMERVNKQIRDQEKAAEKARKEAEKQERLEEKAKKDAEREAERKRKEAEKEEKKRKKEQKEQERKEKEEEKKRKQRSQPTLSAFFGQPSVRRGSISSRDSTSPAPSAQDLPGPSADGPAQSTPCKKKDISAYDKIFPEFFVRNDVRVAPINRFERDEEASEALRNTLDNYIIQHRSPGKHRPYDAAALFHLLDNNVALRGKRCMPVKDIMAEMSGRPERPIDLTTDSQNSQIKRTEEMLRKVPLKYLKFQEDVRPPYTGTYTSRPVSGILRLARNFKRRDLPNTNYDYDSEAEWVEDEDAEDCNSDGEEDEDGLDDMEDMDGFLDDENDENPQSRRTVLQGDLEPVSTGLCWEDRKRRNTNVKMIAYRMEIMLSDPKVKSIDPFSTQYWEPAPVSIPGNMDPPRLPLNTMKGNNTLFNMPISTKSVKPLQVSQSQATTTVTAPKAAKKLITPDAMEEFKREVSGSDLSKVGLIEVLKKKFPKQKAAAIKATLEQIAKREGGKEVDKRWVLVDKEEK